MSQSLLFVLCVRSEAVMFLRMTGAVESQNFPLYFPVKA